MKQTREKQTRELSINRSYKERAYLLHQRPYSETSLICYFFTRKHGIVHILIKGARKPRGNYAHLQRTSELLISWSGKSSLKTLSHIEEHNRHLLYGGEQLALLLYTGELLMKLLKPHDAHSSLYDDYDEFLRAQAESPQQRNIRLFEHRMFAALGYGVPYSKDYKSGESIKAEKHYIYEHSHGWTQTEKPSKESFGGDILLSLAKQALRQPQVLQAAKRLSRIILHHLMEGRPLVSRQLLYYKGRNK